RCPKCLAAQLRYLRTSPVRNVYRRKTVGWGLCRCNKSFRRCDLRDSCRPRLDCRSENQTRRSQSPPPLRA
ncbi:hypothetical protein PFISCL1PPCAC_9235, partial [Pristionchus fissidentatus]